MENMSLILIIFIIGAVIGALLTGSSQRHYDDYYHNRYYHPPPMPYHGYRERSYGSGIFFFVLIVISLFALLLFFADSEPATVTPNLPARYGSTEEKGSKPAAVTLRTCYLEIGRYPTWESAHDAQRRLAVIHQQNLDLLKGQSAGTAYHLVIGPFRGPEAAEAHRARHKLKARVVYFD